MELVTAQSQPDVLTRLLSRLPAELRVEIYSHLLPLDQRNLDVLADHRELQWLATSRAIFEDAAPLVYSKAGVYFDLEPEARCRRASIASAFASHVQTTYMMDREWTAELIRSKMMKKVMMELWCASFDDILELLSWLQTQSLQLSRFTALEELSISIRNQFVGSKDDALLTFGTLERDEDQRNALLGSEALRDICQEIRRIKKNLPPKCAVQWSFRGHVLPTVAFLRLNVPEQPPTPKEQRFSQFMERMWRFIDSHSDERLNELGIGR